MPGQDWLFLWIFFKNPEIYSRNTCLGLAAIFNALWKGWSINLQDGFWHDELLRVKEWTNFPSRKPINWFNINNLVLVERFPRSPLINIYFLLFTKHRPYEIYGFVLWNKINDYCWVDIFHIHFSTNSRGKGIKQSSYTILSFKQKNKLDSWSGWKLLLIERQLWILKHWEERGKHCTVFPHKSE